MKKIFLTLVLISFTISIFSQQFDPTREIRKLIQEGKYQQAEAQLTSLIATAPAPEFFYLLGYSQFRRGSYLESITSLEKALEGKDLLPKREVAATYFMLGAAYKTISNYEKSMTYLSDGLKFAKGTDLYSPMKRMLSEVEAKSEYMFWTQKEGKFVEFHYLKTKGFEERINYILPEYDKIASNFIKRYKIKLKKKIKVFYYGTKSYFKKFFPREDTCLIDLKNSSLYGYDDDRFYPQFVHILTYKIAGKNYPSIFITEGFNEYLSFKNHINADKTASFFNHTHKIPPYNFINDLFFFKNYPESFDLAHSFISYTIKNVGFNSFMNFWKNGSGKIKKDFEKFFGIKNFNDFYRGWISYVSLKKYGDYQVIRPIFEEFISNGEFDLALPELKKVGGNSSLKRVLSSLCLIALGKEKEGESLLKNINCKSPLCMITAGNIYDLLGKREFAKKYYLKIISMKNPPLKLYDAAKSYLKSAFRKEYLNYLKKGGKESRSYFYIRYKMRLGLDVLKILNGVIKNSRRERIEYMFLNFPQPPDLKLAYLKGFKIKELEKYTNGRELFKNWKNIRNKIDEKYLIKFITSASKKLPPEKIISFLRNSRVTFDEMVKYLNGSNKRL